MSRLVLLFCLAFIFCLPFFCMRAHAGPHLVLIPKISFPETEYNLGLVDEGIEVKHVFKIANIGDKKLLIKTAFSTCGCTIPKIKKKEIAPGETGDLEVIMNTSMKQGNITKPIEIHSNDPVNPVSTIYIKVQVKNPHGELSGDRSAAIFAGRCAACHVAKGVGQTGETLYNADCAMCHGFRAKGVPTLAPALVPLDYHNKDLSAAMKEIISHGSKVHRSMPGFAKEAGGPLNEKEIDSLIEFLKTKSDYELKAAGTDQATKESR